MDENNTQQNNSEVTSSNNIPNVEPRVESNAEPKDANVNSNIFSPSGFEKVEAVQNRTVPVYPTPDSNTVKLSRDVPAKPVRKGFWRKVIFTLGCLFGVIFLCGVILPLGAWATGYLPDNWRFINIAKSIDDTFLDVPQMNKAVCALVESGSQHYTNLDCGKYASSDQLKSNSSSQSQVSNVANSSATSSNQVNSGTVGDLKSEETSILNLVAKTEDSVVTVVANVASGDSTFLDDSGTTGQNIGSGFIIQNDGLIVTNSHVVDDETLTYSVIVKNEKTAIPVDKIYRDPLNDIAFLKINKSGLVALPFADSDTLKKGQFTLAIGSPLGDLTGTITTGIISGLNRDVTAGDSFGGSTKKYVGVIQTDAAINPGNSGGPLINSDGQVIGINFATSSGNNNISFALPINRVKIKLAEYTQYGRLLQPYVGVAIQQGRYYTKTEVLYGALVNQVVSGSPAATAGIKVKDVILSIDGETLESKAFSQIIQSKKVGDKVKLEVWRSGTKMTIEVTVEDKGQG